MSIATAHCLQGIRVLDLSRVLAGPWCTQTLADLGATVLKIEQPEHGDDTRHWGPPFMPSGDAAYFQCANGGKRSLAVDFSQPEGQALLERLLQHCDLVVENFKPGSLARYGLDPAQLLQRHPGLVVCSISGFGHTGPLRERAGYDFIVQAMGGLMSVTGPAEGGAHKVGVAVADLFTGLYAAIGILGALRHRERSGQGQHIDLALFDCQLAMLANLASQTLCSGEPAQRLGNAHPSIAPYETLPCADGELVLAIGNDRQFSRLVEALGQPGWAQEAQFASNAQRLAHRQLLRERLGSVLQGHPRAHWLALLEPLGVPAAAVQNVAEALAHPQAVARGMVADSAACSVASPLRLSATPVRPRQAPPRLGQHTQQVLDELGLDAAEQAALWRSGALGGHPETRGGQPLP